MSSRRIVLRSPTPASDALGSKSSSPAGGLTQEEELELLLLLEAEERDRAAALAIQAEPLLGFVPRVSPHILRPDHLAPLAALFERVRRGERVRALVSVPAQHGKTTFILHVLAALLAADPTLPLAYITYAQDVADSKSHEARQIARTAGVDLAADRQNLAEWRTGSGGGCRFGGIGGPLTGSPARLVVVDDPFKNRVEAESPTIRERVHGWYTSVALTRLPEDGSAIVVHTRWHQDDLIGRLEREGGYEVINLPFVFNDAGEFDPEGGTHVLWPRQLLPDGKAVGWTLEGARARLAEVGPYDAASIYGGRPRPREGKMFREPARFTALDLDGARIVLAVDPAGSDSPQANHSVAVALAVRGHGIEQTADLVGLLRFQLRPEHAAPRLLAFQRRWGARLRIEGSRDGKEMARCLALIAPDLEVETLQAIGNKALRAEPVATAWNAGRVRVPADPNTISCAPEDLSEFVRVVTNFVGLADGEDDDVDALAHAWNASASGAPITRDAVKATVNALRSRPSPFRPRL